MSHRSMVLRPEGVRLTHLPTGTTAESRNCAPRVGKWAYYDRMARSLLAARVCRPATTPIKRSYHLHSPLGIEPFIQQDGVRLAQGADAVRRVLEGEIPLPSNR